jgi:outer membrane receptor protein involved in Fe transport
VLAQLCATAVLTSASAQQSPAANATQDAQALAKYDKNKNGRLDPDELATMRSDETKAANAVATSTAPSADSEKIVELSPFEVSGAEDTGYAASNTLAGTRLNSRLEDIAGSVSVVTKQQLLDTAAVDINDIFLTEIATEGTGQFTDMTTDGRGDYDNVAGNPTGANRMRGLSAANIAMDGFSASSSIPIDTYNVAAVEISRGANSSLAGVGEAGGTVNLVQNRANLNRSTTNVSARVDSYDGFRVSLDLNRPIIQNKLSMRFSSVYEEKGYVRKPSMERNDRQTIGFTYRPFRTTTLTASYERVSQYANRANSVTPRDTITPWRANGAPTWDWTTLTFTRNGVKQAPTTRFSVNTPPGIVGIGSSGVRVLQYIDDGKVHFMMNGNNGNIQVFSKSSDLSAEGGLFKIKATTDKSIYDWEEINLAAPNFEIQNANVTNAKLEQTILNTRRLRLNGEVAWRREDQEIYTRSFIAQLDGVGSSLSVDTNEYLNDGRKNPFLGRPFIGGVNPQVFRKLNFADNFRAQLAADLDLTRENNILKWLGRHRASGYGEYRNTVRAPSLRLHDTIDAHPYFNPATTAAGVPRNLSNNAGALFYPLYYFGKSNLTNGGGVEYANTGLGRPTGSGFFASYPTVATSNTVLTSPYAIDQPVDIREAFFSAQTVQKKKNRTIGGTIQSFFLRDSIVTTFGKRKDRVYTIDRLGNEPVVNGYTDEWSTLNFGANKRWRQGDTDTKGVVVRPFKELPFVRNAAEGSGFSRFFGQTLQGLSFHYNESQNFSPADAAYNLYLQELPNPSGRSKEYGFGLSLFDRKLTMRVTKQETIQEKSRAGTGVLATRALSIDFDIPGQNRNFDLYQSLRDWYLGTTTTPGLHPEWTEDQFRTKAAQVMGYPREFIDAVTSGNYNIADTSDALSTGTEVEIQFNPSRYWTVRATGGQQKAIESNISAFIQQFMAEREPLWRSIFVPTELRADGTPLPFAGLPWFTDPTLPGDTPENYFLGTVQQPVNIAIANQGKVKTQGREYSANVTTRYQLAGLFSENKWLRNVSIGGSYRWASRAVIGYLGAPADPDGIVRKLDRDKPVYDKATGNLDLMVSYNTRMFSNRVRANFQFNIRNATENGRLQGVGVNPDGQFWQFRIIDPRQFILSASFDL